MNLRVLLTAALVFSQMLGGCLGDSTDEVPSRILRDECPSLPGTTCLSSQGSILVRNLDLKGSGDEPGLVLTPKHSNIQLENVSISGFDIALVVDLTSCEACSIQLTDMHLSAGTLGILLQGTTGNVNIRHAGIQTNGGGYLTNETLPDGTSLVAEKGGSQGIQLPQASTMQLRLVDVTLNASTPSVSGAISAPGAQLALIEVDGLSITNYRRGISVTADKSTLENIRIGCQDLGITVYAGMPSPVPFMGRNITINGCKGGALHLGFDTVDLAGIAINGAAFGIQSGAKNFSIHEFRIENTDYGIHMPSDNSGMLVGTYVNGVISNSSYAGIEAKYNAVRVENVTFSNNGHRWPDPSCCEDPRLDAMSNYGGLITRYSNGTQQAAGDTPNAVAVVRGCSFINNSPFGYSNLSLLRADARLNWWNATDGPRVSTYLAGLDDYIPSWSVGGHGDNVSMTVDYVPFLVGPP